MKQLFNKYYSLGDAQIYPVKNTETKKLKLEVGAVFTWDSQELQQI